MSALPTGTVTFLFTDIEGSTRLLQSLADRYATLIADHHRLLRGAFREHGGVEVETHGDGLYYTFPSAKAAVLAAVAAQRAVLAHPWPEGGTVRVRVGMHTGEAMGGETGLVGIDVHRAARICDAGHGGQILLSQATEALIADGLPPSIRLRDLGAHRLKDLQRPERIYQVLHPELPADFPRLNSLDALPNNLPVQLSSFVGRQREMAEVRRLLQSSRLLTLTGAAGSGKTRLALQVAADMLNNFPGGAWLVELAHVTDPALVPQAVASAVDVPEDPGRDLTTTLADALHHRQMLLILDNCEHLLAQCVRLTDTLLRACPNLRILATSREGLGITGETTFPVPPLSMPEPKGALSLQNLRDYEPISLFIDRATTATPAFRVTDTNSRAVVQVCRRLDGIPLAIELAAARAKVLSPEEIAARLDDRFRLLTGGSRAALPRHQTLKAAMDWSHDLLSEAERVLLRRLSVFAGGFTLEAAEAICAGDAVDQPEVLDLLTHLVDKSLVLTEVENDQTRYRQLETVRQYARDRLFESGEDGTVRDRHLDWFQVLARKVDRFSAEYAQERWMDRVEREHDNLRAALKWAREKRPEEGLRLTAALGWFWQVRAHINEGREWLEDALSRNPAPTLTRAHALVWAVTLADVVGDAGREAALAEEHLTLARMLGDRRMEAFGLLFLGDVALEKGERTQGIARYRESLAISRELGDRKGMANALRDLGDAVSLVGDHRLAAELLEEGLSLFREHGDPLRLAQILVVMARAAENQDQYQRARALIEESLTLNRATGARMRVARNLTFLAAVARLQGDFAHATALGEESLALHRDHGYKAGITEALLVLAYVAGDQGDLSRAEALGHEALVLGFENGLDWITARARHHLGAIAFYQNDYARATTLLEEAQRFYRDHDARTSTAYTLVNLAWIALRRSEAERAEMLARESLMLFRERGRPSGIGEALELLAAVAASRGPERAARLLGAAEALREHIGRPHPPIERPEYERWVAVTRGALGEERGAAAWTEGRAMTQDQAVQYALAPDGG